MGIFSFLNKNPAPTQPELEDLIYEVAEHKRDEDFHELYRIMREREVYVPVDPSSLPTGAAHGQTIVTDSTMAIRMKSARLPNGKEATSCATCIDSSILQGGYVGMKWLGYLEMTLKIDPPFYGALLQGRRSWIVFDVERIRYILRQ